MPLFIFKYAKDPFFLNRQVQIEVFEKEKIIFEEIFQVLDDVCILNKIPMRL